MSHVNNKKSGTVKLRGETQAGSSAAELITSKKAANNPIVGRRIENEGTVELDNDQMQKMPHMVFSARARPKSSDTTSSKRPAFSANSRNNLGKRKSTASSRDTNTMLQRLESIKSSLSTRIQSTKNQTKRCNPISAAPATLYNTKPKEKSPKVTKTQAVRKRNNGLHWQQSESSDRALKPKEPRRTSKEKWRNHKVESKIRQKLAVKNEPRKNPLARCKSQEALRPKLAKPAVKQIPTKPKEEDRISRLGLEFVYMQEKYKTSRGLVSCKSQASLQAKPKRSENVQAQKQNILHYMKKKKELEMFYKKKLELEELKKRERINQNQNKLAELVHNIFKNKSPVKKKKKNASRKPRERRQKSVAVAVGTELLENEKPDSPMLERIRQQLIREMASNCNNTGSVEDTVSAMHRSQSQNIFIDKGEKAVERKHEDDVKDRSATRIQSCYRGYLSRKKYSEFKISNFLNEIKDDIQRTERVDSSLENFNAIDALNGFSQHTDEKLRKYPSQSQGVNTDAVHILVSKEAAPPKTRNMQFTTCPVESINIKSKDKAMEEPADTITTNYKKRNLRIEIESQNTPTPQNNPVAVPETSSNKNDSIELDKDFEPAKQSIFNRNPFHAFSLQKYGRMDHSDSLSELLKTREKAISYKEKHERKLISKLYKKKKISQSSYQSKRKELEKWVTTEREEIKKTKSQLLDTWKKTVEMIEATQKGSLQLKRFFMQHAISYTSSNNSMSGGNSTLSRLESAINHATFDEGVVGLEAHNVPKSENTRKVSDTPIFIQEDSPASTAKHVTPQPISPTVEKEALAAEPRNEIIILDQVQIPIRDTSELSKSICDEIFHKAVWSEINEAFNNAKTAYQSKKELGEELTTAIYAALLGESLTNLFPPRDSAPKAAQPASKYTTLALACKKSPGADLYRINDYVDEVFLELFVEHRGQFMEDLNKPVPMDPKEVLDKLQNPDQGKPWQYQLPHEVAPIIPLDVYLEVEKKKEISKPEAELNMKNSLSDSQQLALESDHIYNKAIFDAINEALNLIRPYGISGEPMPWSAVQRLLYTKIGDANIVVRNVKNIALNWSSFEVGTIPRADFLLDGTFDEEYFSEVRERKLINLLAQEIIDNEEQWVNYEMEEAEVKIDLADMIMEKLVTETAEILMGIHNKRIVD